MRSSCVRLLCVGCLMFLNACAYHSPLIDHGGGRADCAQDGSSSPLTEEQAKEIARSTVLEHEHWTESRRDEDGHWHVIDYQLQRINEGGWRVDVRRVIIPANHGCMLHDEGLAVILIIDRRGRVTHYAYQA